MLKQKAKLDKLDEDYRLGHPRISDQEFDRLVEEFEAKYKTEYSPPTVDLPILMPSVKKIKTSAQLKKWLSTVSGDKIVIQRKYDGISVASLRDGRKFTKGGGVAREFQLDFPVPNDDVRGELILDTRFPLDPAFSSRRSHVASLVATLGDRELPPGLRFVVYKRLFDDSPVLEQKLSGDASEKLVVSSPAVSVAENLVMNIEDVTYDALKKVLEHVKTGPFECDGLVLYDPSLPFGDNPKYMTNAIAFKVDDIFAEVTVSEIKWEVSGTKLIPTIWFPETKLGDLVQTKISGSNAKFLIKNQIAPGARIEIVLSGGVIGVFKRTIVPAKDMSPVVDLEGDYTFDGTNYILNSETPESIAKLVKKSWDKLGRPSGIAKARKESAGYESFKDWVSDNREGLTGLDLMVIAPELAPMSYDRAKIFAAEIEDGQSFDGKKAEFLRVWGDLYEEM